MHRQPFKCNHGVTPFLPSPLVVSSPAHGVFPRFDLRKSLFSTLLAKTCRVPRKAENTKREFCCPRYFLL
jgi:hypothetical protein